MRRSPLLTEAGLDATRLSALQAGCYRALNDAAPSHWQSKSVNILENAPSK